MNFPHLIRFPENRSALVAAERAAAGVGGSRPRGVFNPLFVHGPSGTGKTTLVSGLVREVGRRRPRATIVVLSAGDFRANSQPNAGDVDRRGDLREADMLVIEDLQRLRARASERLTRIVDRFRATGRQMIFTATGGPASLAVDARLRSRLGAGLIVGLRALQKASRLEFLRKQAKQKRLAMSEGLLARMAGRLSGSMRELEGTLNRVAVLARVHRQPIDDATWEHILEVSIDPEEPGLDRIVERVAAYFHVASTRLLSGSRAHSIVRARQVGMFLARRLTTHSLGEIGAYFGGRDHSTVLHACRKTENALGNDPALSGAVSDLESALRP